MGGFSAHGRHKVIVDVPVYQRIKKRNLVDVFHFHGEVDSVSSCAKEGC